MSNRRFNQFFLTPHAKPVMLNVDIPIGATGAVGTLANNTGVTSVTRLTTGVYKIVFADNYNKLLAMDFSNWSTTSGSSVLIASLTPGVVYQITILGAATTAQWVTAGVPVGITPAVGVVFKCAATSAGTSSACQTIAVSTIDGVEISGNPNTTLNSSPIGAGYVVVSTLASTSSSVTTLIPTDPASGSTVQLNFYFNDSSLVTGY